MNRARKHQPAARPRVTESPYFRQRSIREAIIEARLREITNFVESFDHAPYLVLLSERASTREAVEELCVKESALRWIVRVAKHHSEGLVRETLWRDIEKAVTELEKLAQSVMLSGKVLPFPDSALLRPESAETPPSWSSVT